jgi:outer membrane protein OmpA-like peptidoglycan-associated protein
MKSLSLLVTATALCIAAMGCHTTPTRMTYLPNHESPSPSDLSQKLVTDGTRLDSDNPVAVDFSKCPNWSRDPKIFEALTVHFDHDSTVVKSEETPKLREIALYLKANPSKALCIEGHCDEQGTEEYNRSLGDRRALALREALAKLDVEAARLDTISYGKDRPIDTAKSEAASRLNRRGEFVVLTPPKQLTNY